MLDHNEADERKEVGLAHGCLVAQSRIQLSRVRHQRSRTDNMHTRLFARALGHPPRTTMYCYINFRNAIADMIPVPGMPVAFIARETRQAGLARHGDKKKPEPAGPPSSAAQPDLPDDLPAYRWPWLDGRYFYIARGRTAVERHLGDMGGEAGLRSIDKLYERCVEQRKERESNAKAIKQRQILGIEDPDQE